jgi:glycerol-3-phosphate acyltransferase PlsY
MNLAWQIALLLVGAYLLGGIPFGLLVARAKGVDIRRHGSGNVGATNVGRVLGRKWCGIVFVLDVAKGAVSTLAAGKIIAMEGVRPSSQADLVWLAAALACVLGSVAPVYLRFKGGKGVAASLGVLLGIYPYLTFAAMVVLAVWLIVVLTTRYVSLASIIASGALPLVFAGLAWRLDWRLEDHVALLGLCAAMTTVVWIRHRDNMHRLWAGTENRLGQSAQLPEGSNRDS